MSKRIQTDSKNNSKTLSFSPYKELKIWIDSNNPLGIPGKSPKNLKFQVYKRIVKNQRREVSSNSKKIHTEGSNEIEDLLKVRTIYKSLNNSLNSTPSCLHQLDLKKNEHIDFSPSNISDESASLYYPNEPKIHDLRVNEIKIYDSKVHEPKIHDYKLHESRLFNNTMNNSNNKEFFLQKTKVIIQKSNNYKKRWQSLCKEHKFSSKPLKALTELNPTAQRIRLKGKVFRGSCVYSCKTPLPKLIHNIKLSVWNNLIQIISFL